MVIIATSFGLWRRLSDVEQVNAHDVLLRAFPHAVELLLVHRGEEDSLHGGQAAGIRGFLCHVYTSLLFIEQTNLDFLAQQIKPFSA